MYAILGHKPLIFSQYNIPIQPGVIFHMLLQYNNFQPSHYDFSLSLCKLWLVNESQVTFAQGSGSQMKSFPTAVSKAADLQQIICSQTKTDTGILSRYLQNCACYYIFFLNPNHYGHGRSCVIAVSRMATVGWNFNWLLWAEPTSLWLHANTRCNCLRNNILSGLGLARAKWTCSIYAAR